MTRAEDIISRNNTKTLADPKTQERMRNSPKLILIGSYPADELYTREDEAKSYLSQQSLTGKGFDAVADLDDGLDTRAFGRLNLSAPSGTPEKEYSKVVNGILRSFKE